jgi:serine phosphatase RsbU (regulator of sigma subunit)/uncharacterized protein YigA (DUF484 family)
MVPRPMCWEDQWMPHIGTGESAPWRLDPSLLDGLWRAALVVDREMCIIYANDAAQVVLGYPRERLLGEHLPSTFFAESDHASIVRALTEVFDDTTWSGDMAVLGFGGLAHPASLACSPVWSDGRPHGALVLIDDHSQQSPGGLRARRQAERLTRLARVTTELMMADNLEAVTKVVIEHAAHAAGATMASLCLLVDENTLSLVGLSGAGAEEAADWATFPIDAGIPSSEAVRLGERIVVSGRDAVIERYPVLADRETTDRSLVSLPLKVGGRVIGSAGFSFPGRRGFDSTETEFFGILADMVAQAIDRVHALAGAADQETKLQFLADASAELASSLDYQATLKKVAELAVPKYADWCSIQLVKDGDLHTLAVAHTDPAKVAMAEDLQRRYPPDRNAPRGAYHIMRTGVSELIPEIPDELLVEATQDETHLALARALNLRSAMSVPLKVRDEVIGVISWVAGDHGRRFTQADLALGEDLARRAAVAIDNSQLHSEILEAAGKLQRAVLPEKLPTMAGWDLGVYYSPAGRTDVGGDFYDVVPVDGGVALFVGDVMGRGVAAAAAMAQMRAAVRAYLAIDPDPVSVLGKLDVMFAKYDISSLVTLVYAVAYPDRDELRVVNAGHPPPVLIRSDGSVEQLAPGSEGPVGLAVDERASVVLPFFVGDQIVAFTDGLIERRTEDIDEGQRRVMEHAHLLSSSDLSSALAVLVGSVRDRSSDDDVAVLAARRTS